MKITERSIYDAKIPNIVLHRQDDRTIKIPIPKFVDPYSPSPVG